jgi:Protein of unknown function (DUF1345)
MNKFWRCFVGGTTPDPPTAPADPDRSGLDPFRPLHGGFGLLVAAGLLLGLAVQAAGVRWFDWDLDIGLMMYWLVMVSALLVPAWSWILGNPGGLKARVEAETKARVEAETKKHQRPKWRSGIGFPTAVAAADLVIVATVLAKAKQLAGLPQSLLVAICIVGVALGWLLIHTTHAVHYLWLHYETGTGLHFPDENEPDLVDFLYFACAAGATFGTTDVQVQSRSIRRAVLRHAGLAFAVNTVILAMVVSYLGNYLQ